MITKEELIAILKKAQSLQQQYGIAASFKKKGLIPIDAVGLTAVPRGEVQSLARHMAQPNGAPAQHPSWSSDLGNLWREREDAVSVALIHYLGDDNDLTPGKKNRGIRNALRRLK